MKENEDHKSPYIMRESGNVFRFPLQVSELLKQLESQSRGIFFRINQAYNDLKTRNCHLLY